MPSRPSVQVVLRDSMSTSPDCSAVKRFCVVVGTNFVLFTSPSAAVATARQESASMPRMTPWLSGSEKPGTVPAMPHSICPRFSTASSVAEPDPCAAADGAQAIPASNPVANSMAHDLLPQPITRSPLFRAGHPAGRATVR